MLDERDWWRKYAKIHVEDGGLQGILLLEAEPHEGMQLTLPGLQEFLNSAGVVYGVDTVLCQQVIMSATSYVKQRIRIASGIAPVAGRDAVIEVFLEEENGHKPRVLENGRVDYFDMGAVKLVQQGQVLAKRIPPTDGQNGVSVTGQPIHAKRGKDFRLPQGQNTEIQDDNLTLVAAAEGHVVYTPKDNKIHVYSEYVVPKDVDFSVGNISFTGSVRVNGNVQPGFRIQAAGDIEIQGYVDAAYIEAAGNITIRGGVQGRNKGEIRAGGNLRTPFIQSALVDVGGNCLVGESIMHSQVSAGGRILMEGRRAVIVGGIVRAGEEVATRVLGSPMATPTEVEVGVHPHLRREAAEIHESLKELLKNIDKTQKAIALLENMAATAGALPPDKAQLLQKLKITLEHYKVEEEDLMLRRSEIELTLHNIKSARVNVFETSHSGVKITISNFVYFVRDGISKVAFVIQDAEVRPIPL